MNTIALILESNREYGRELLKGVASFACERKNWQLKMIPQLGIESKSLLDGCDGVIARVTDYKAMRRLLTLKLPVIDLFRQGEPSCAIGVGCDNRQIAIMAANYFLRRGFRSFAFCGYSGTRYSDERFAAFSSTVGDAGFPCSDYPAVEKPADIISHGDQAMRPRNMRRFATWVAKLPPHTAVFCANDIRAYHVLRVCNEIGREVPSDIAIMGVDNDIVLCSCAPVSLTSIDPNAFGIGYAAARLLDAAIADPSIRDKQHPVFHVKPSGLIERGSTAVYPVNQPWLTNVLTFIDSNMREPITASDLVKIASVSHTALQKTFRKVFGLSAGKYILDVKMHEARRLCAKKDLRVKEIAAATGFRDPHYFCRVYRSYFGRPPTHDKK